MKRVLFVCLGNICRSPTAHSVVRQLAAEQGLSAIRFDYSGHGVSGGDFAKGTISRWTEEALAVIAATGVSKVVLIGSSMGGWIALRVIQEARRLNLPKGGRASLEDAQAAATLWMSGIDFIQGNLVQQADRDMDFDFQQAVL